ncbi:Hypothetical predicted protein [Mytilus galloprovincialis]|uniref:Uncharacterized protein n=1 Tax=Mytilus galloprovincialis TaxID=29158 RepID=A0A8B6G8M6_MYTGA|nr:Hypothetical predicted protein [Mytilus galloprovincialis]
MVIPFIRSLKGTNQEATVENYFRFYKEFLAHNSNHAFLHLQICRFSQAIINFRMGMRRNNAESEKHAKYHLKELFCGRFHPHYQTIELFDCIQYKFMSDEVKTVWDDTISFIVSGDPSKGQDLDFVLEEKNKEEFVKSTRNEEFLPKVQAQPIKFVTPSKLSCGPGVSTNLAHQQNQQLEDTEVIPVEHETSITLEINSPKQKQKKKKKQPAKRKLINFNNYFSPKRCRQ